MRRQEEAEDPLSTLFSGKVDGVFGPQPWARIPLAILSEERLVGAEQLGSNRSFRATWIHQMMVNVHYKHFLVMLEESSAASNTVERGSVPVMLGSAPRCSNPPLNGANSGPHRWLDQLDYLDTHNSDVGARRRAAGL